MTEPTSFEERRKHLADMNDEQLKERFWELTDKIVSPMMELGYRNTTPSIERSVLLRMGFSSIEAGALVKAVLDHGLLAKGAGHVVFIVSRDHALGIREAGLALINGQYWNEVTDYFSGRKS